MTHSPLRVVLVDDLPEVRRLLATALRLRGGFEVVGEAGDGPAAVDVVARTGPDVVVLDLGLPSLRGADLLRALREAAPSAKVVVFTGIAATEGETVRGQVEGYVPKDDDVATLLDLIEDLGTTDRHVAVLALPPVAESTRAAREYLTFHARRWGYAGDLYEAELVVAELVANALEHARPPFALRVGLAEGALHVEVLDGTAAAPELSDDDSQRRWHGLTYVSLLSQAWGVTPREGEGKTVWARLVPGPVPAGGRPVV